MVLVALGNYGVTTAALPVAKACQQDQPTASPQPLAHSLDRLASDVMAEQALFGLGGRASNLSWVVKHVSDTEFLLGVSNTQLTEQPLKIESRFGDVESITEISLDDSEKAEPGYLPHGFRGRDIGLSTNHTIAGADFRMLRVTVRPTTLPPGIRVLPHSVFPRAPTKIWLRLGAGEGDLKAAVQRRVGFRQLYSGVLLDSSYLSVRSLTGLQADAVFMATQRLSIGVDLSSAIDMFPGLRLGNFSSDPVRCSSHTGVCGNGEFFAESMAVIRDVMHKCAAINCSDVLFTLHKAPELGPNDTVVKAEMTATVKLLVAEAAALKPSVRLHLRQSSKNAILAGSTAASTHAWVQATSKSLLFAPNTGMAAVESADLISLGAFSSSSLLLVDGVSDLYLANRHGTETAPVLGSSSQLLVKIEQYIQAARRANSTVILDATYMDLLQEEADTVFLEGALRAQLPPTPSPPAPPTPPPPGSHCYTLGTAVLGICSVAGRTAPEKIIMACPTSLKTCYADEMLPSGKWAGAYGGHFAAVLTPENEKTAVTKLTIDRESRWLITVKTALGTGNWTSQPGVLPLSDVASIQCTNQNFVCANRSRTGIKLDDEQAVVTIAQPSDKNATAATRSLFARLAHISATPGLKFAFGQQRANQEGRGWQDMSGAANRSDILTDTGDWPAVFGFNFASFLVSDPKAKVKEYIKGKPLRNSFLNQSSAGMFLKLACDYSGEGRGHTWRFGCCPLS